ncbi:nuclear fragile X mental retardation-interacting protein 1, partial [Staphylococcus aureus]|nr:nuclear fragile X mental retardation-interacting protein 1 [Staphylococcus aureus]MBO8492348.1 nuclear fragile X mental retardation-interacting protein 1 [Staphylococcus aureus]MBO8517843.1 nuclear fragile X mental retardation-interacting protein 1 [Staphylococcus aureus]MBO8525784.1 nuclear fragile X mental retardation-interacting protein 1 [Staphylococcus aureus]MBO8533892.1 nuclear fragile X mental retardation-interacting protein 1 [Staphylococcus aureus]
MTEDLIPLYAVGVFIPFTLAQFGMVIKWIHERPKNWLSKLSVQNRRQHYHQIFA